MTGKDGGKQQKKKTEQSVINRVTRVMLCLYQRWTLDVPGGGIIGMGIPGGPRGGIIIGAGMPPMSAGEGPPTPRTGPDDRGRKGEGMGDRKGKEMIR